MFPTSFKLAKFLQSVNATVVEQRIKITNKLIANINNIDQRQQYLSILVDLSNYEQQIIEKIKNFEFDDKTDFDWLIEQIKQDLISIEHV